MQIAGSVPGSTLSYSSGVAAQHAVAVGRTRQSLRSLSRPPLNGSIVGRTAMPTVSAERIEELHRQLNSPGRIPERYYRRNVVQYELVSYLAAIVALWTSRNLPVLHTFLDRASEALERLRPHLDDSYAEFVGGYLRALAQHLLSCDDLPADLKSSLPRRLLQNHP